MLTKTLNQLWVEQ